MAQEITGTPAEYSELINSLAESAANRVGLTGDKLAKANDILNKINAANLGLQQFGFYKKLTSALKNASQETVEDLKSKLATPKTPLGQEGTELKEFTQPEEAIPSEELMATQRGVLGRQILGDRPTANEEVRQDTAEAVEDAPISKPEAQVAETVVSEEVAPAARVALAQQLSAGELSQSIQTGGIGSRISGAVSQLQDFQGAFEDGVSRVNQLRLQASQVGQQLKDAANQKVAQGRQMIQDGQDALNRGEAGGQDLIEQGQGMVEDALKQASNSDLVQSQISSARNLYSQGQSLLSEGKSAGLQLIEQGNEQIKTAQSAIQGYGEQAQALQQSLQTELDTRVGQLQDLAGRVASTAGEASQIGQNVAKAAAGGDIEGAVQGGQQLAKLAGGVAGQIGSETGEKIAAGISEALPVAGEVVGAGLFLASLFTGIAEAFKPHESMPIYTTSFQSGL